MDTVTIVVVVVVITLLAAALAWYGPRRRDWRSHMREEEAGKGRSEGDSAGESPDDRSGIDRS